MADVLASPAWMTPLPVPTVDRTDKRWKSNAFWRGDVWPPTNYQVATGLAALRRSPHPGIQSLLEISQLGALPLTTEDVLAIVERERPHGVIVQFGGQTPLSLSLPLERAGVSILRTPPDAIDRAEDREQFQAMLKKLGLVQPENGTATTVTLTPAAAATGTTATNRRAGCQRCRRYSGYRPPSGCRPRPPLYRSRPTPP